MPNPKLSDKYKGLSFGQIAKAIEKKYEDRFDPISTRGKMAEMGTLRDEQEYVKQKQQIQENLKQVLAQAQQLQIPQQVDPTQMSNPMVASNEGVAPQMLPPQDMGHSASQSYNQQFGYGGTMDYADGGLLDFGMKRFGNPTFESTPTTFSFSPQQNPVASTVPLAQYQGVQPGDLRVDATSEQINPLRYAPLLANIYNIAATRKPKSTASTLQGMGIRTQVDESLANQVQPRQTQFNNIDFSNLERGITNQARAFTGTNMNVSGGNAGQFVANELANQGNVMNAIAQARLAQQQGNQQVSQLNAQEQARIDQFQLAQSGQQQQVQAQNIGIGMQLADLDARNQGAATSNRLANIAGLATNLGNIGREEDQMKMIANALGYSSFGTFMESMSPEEREKALPNLINILQGVFKSR
jgi:hypothetical protein